MQTRQYENPFYTVVLNYDETRPETSYEKELIKRYLNFLEMQARKRKLIKNLTQQLYHEQLLVDEAFPLHKIIEEEFSDISEIVETLKYESFIIPEAFFGLRNKLSQANDSYLAYYAETVENLRIKMNANEEAYQELYAWFEDEEDGKAYTEFDDYAEELYKNYNNYSLDLSQFDTDVEAMKGEWQKLSTEWDEIFSLREETVKNTKSFIDKVNALNESVGKMQKDMDEMENNWSAFNN
jgi:hypothetical protein